MDIVLPITGKNKAPKYETNIIKIGWNPYCRVPPKWRILPIDLIAFAGIY